MSVYWTRVGPVSNMTDVLIIRNSGHKGRCTRTPCDDGVACRLSGVYRSPARTVGNSQKLGTVETFFPEP